MNTMDKLEKISFVGLFVLALLLAGILVYNRGELMKPASEDVNPFDPNHVAKIRIVVKDEDWQQIKNNTRAEQYFRADFWFDGVPYKNVAVRPKGNSSLMSARGGNRMPLKVDFNFFNSAQNFHGVKKLSLNNGFSDPTLIRETLGYELFEQMGLPTPRRAFADVWVNDIHLGLYTIVEQVDKVFIRRNFSYTEGNLYKPEMPAAYLNWTKADLSEQDLNTLLTSKKKNNLNIKIGGSRLGDLITILKREGMPGSQMLPEDTASASQGGPFPGGPGGPDGQFPGDPNGGPFARGFGGRGGFDRGPEGQFQQDPNRPFGRDSRGRGGFAGGPEGGQFSGEPGDPNGPFAGRQRGQFRGGPGGQFPGGPGGQFPQDPNSPFARDFRGGGGFPGGPGMQFPNGPGDPNGPFARGGRGGFGGGPGGRGGPGGGMFGRGGSLLDQMALKTNENYPDHSALFHLLEVLNNCPDETFETEIEKVLDVDEVLRFLAASVLMVHLDNYIGMGHNYYLYEINGKFSVIPWDLNMAFGTFGMGAGGGGITDFYIDEPVTGGLAQRPLVARLLEHETYLDKYHQYLEQMLNGVFAEGVIEARIDELVKLIRPYVEADELKFFTTEDFEKSINEDLAGGRGGFGRGMGRMRGGRNQGGNNEEMSPPEGMDRMPQEFAGGPGGRQGRMEQFGGPGGPGGQGGGGGGPGGMNAPGLKSFIKQRRVSVREQLDGTRAGKSEGGQNMGGSDRFDMFRRDRG